MVFDVFVFFVCPWFRACTRLRTHLPSVAEKHVVVVADIWYGCVPVPVHAAYMTIRACPHYHFGGGLVFECYTCVFYASQIFAGGRTYTFYLCCFFIPGR